MPQQLAPETIAIVKATVPSIAQYGTAITAEMYSRLFRDDHIRALFNHSNQGESGAQVHALAAAILAYAQNIDNLEVLAPVVERIAAKHLGYDILSEHYPYVANALLGAIRQVLGEAATEEVLAAWGEAYWFLANILRDREAALRDELLKAEGGWHGWRRFIVADRVRESSVITSFILRPEDGRPVLRHKPGQYLTFRFGPKSAGYKRNYSISCAPNNEYYRISVKREASGKGGSIFLHDQVAVGDRIKVTAPSGDFFLSETPQRPVILLSGGVGLTPMVSMAETIAAEHPHLATYFVHGALNSETHAMGDHLQRLTQTCSSLRVRTLYSEPKASDVVGVTHDADGFISVRWLQEHTPLEAADIFLCGPLPFLRALIEELSISGVPTDRIHYEIFGPTADLIAA